ncbi:MAG: glycosyltransferase family 39 protein [candidate division WOR-3 bacterium]
MRQAIIFTIILAAIRLAVAHLYPLLPDEAYYWVWSRDLAFGYFDHPPMVGWLVKGGTIFLGNSHLGVRSLFILLSGCAGLLIYLLIRDLSEDRQGFHGLLAGTSALMLGIGGLLAVPDVPLVFFWTLGLLSGIKALKRPGWWLIYGIALGGAMLSKYSGVFLLTVPLAYLFTDRRFLIKPQWWLGLGVSLAIFLPNIIWNAVHGWVSFAFQLGHGLGKGFNPSGPLKYILDAALVNSVFPFVFLLWGTIRATRKFREPSILALIFSFWVPFLFFWAASLRGHAEANWAAPAYMSLVVLGVLGLGTSTKGWAWKASVVFGLALVGIAYIQAVHPFLRIKGDPTERARGWKELAMCVQSVRETYPELSLAASRYQEASELSFYLPGNPTVRVANPSGRQNQITLVYPPGPGEDFIFVGEPEGFSSAELILECRGLRYYNVYLAKGYSVCEY